MNSMIAKVIDVFMYIYIYELSAKKNITNQ